MSEQLFSLDCQESEPTYAPPGTHREKQNFCLRRGCNNSFTEEPKPLAHRTRITRLGFLSEDIVFM